ncbi:MAG: gamma-glutamyltransferase family protein [Conexivisphaera sp.]
MKPPFVSRRGVVASEHPYASMAGLRALEEGGNAVDAAVAISFTLAVSQPALNGLGGDFMATVLRGDRTTFVNGSGWAPRRLTVDLVRGELGLSSIPRYGPLSAVVPGMVGGVHAMWREFGSMEWGRLLSFAARRAREGLPASPALRAAVGSLEGSYSDANTRRIYSAGRWERVDLSGLAAAIEGIAEHGPEFFYRDVGAAIADYVSSIGGVMEPDDFSGYRAEVSGTVSCTYRGYTVHESPPNSQGITTLLILRELEVGVGSGSAGPREMLKAYARAYALRDRYVADPRFVEVPVEELLSGGKGEGGSMAESLGSGDTTNFVVADSGGMVVSGIQSLYHGFGSRVTEPSYGVTLNNRASDFSMEGPNRVEPGKRPLHTLSSVIITRDGEPFAALGTSGGHFRPQQHALLITDMVDRGMDVVEAIDAPRFLWDGESVVAEEGADAGGMDARRIPYPGSTGVAHAIQFHGADRIAYADPRGEGLALGELS